MRFKTFKASGLVTAPLKSTFTFIPSLSSTFCSRRTYMLTNAVNNMSAKGVPASTPPLFFSTSSMPSKADHADSCISKAQHTLSSCRSFQAMPFSRCYCNTPCDYTEINLGRRKNVEAAGASSRPRLAASATATPHATTLTSSYGDAKS